MVALLKGGITTLLWGKSAEMLFVQKNVLTEK